MTQYRISSVPTEHVLAELSEYDPLMQQLLFTRGIVDKDAAAAFLAPSYDDHLHDPFLLHDMDKGVNRILDAIAQNEHIVVYSDYDCDGIPGAVILHDFFTAILYPHFQNYIPHRHFEGFGLNSEAVTKLAEEGARVIITIDCGTSDIEVIEKAAQLGVDVIVTDHHEPKETLPPAVAIINPKVGNSYPFSGLCGSGVVYKLTQALLARGRESGRISLKEGWEKWWLDMVAVATIADMVPLEGENRALTHYGLQVLRKSQRPGLHHLLQKSRTNQRYLTEDDIGFTIGPRINAASRMDTPEDAFRMLATKDEGEAGARVTHLEKLNRERKTTVGLMTKEIHVRLKQMIEIPDVLVLGNPEWRPSLVGLAANALAEEYNRPVFLWGRDGKGIIKGSCRSGGNVSVVRLMEQCADIFLEHGGHHVAGGFAVQDAHIHTLPETLLGAYHALKEEALHVEELQVDATLLLEQVDTTLLSTLRILSPFGTGNPKPLFEFKNIVPSDVGTFGKGSEHLKMRFDHTKGMLEAIAFFKNTESFSKVPVAGESLTLLAHVETSYFMNRLQTRLRIVDIL